MRHGFLLIDKKEGPTSHDVVAEVRRILHERNIGHLGTLDPLASGLLVLAVGSKALKVVELFEGMQKFYEARIIFGKVSATYDREGPIEEVTSKKGWTPPTDVQLQEILRKHFLGELSQTPPLYSAVHIEGKRAYEVVRQNPQISLDLPPRNVKVTKLQLTSYGYPRACLHIECSAGTYVRSLAHDLGQLLRCGAYLESLRRLHSGHWKLEDAKECKQVTWADVIPLKEALQSFSHLDLTDEQWKNVRNGRSIDSLIEQTPLIAWHEGLPVAFLERDKNDSSKAHPRKVF